MTKELYETDGYKWYMTNAELLKQKRFDEIDYLNIAEELESMGRSEQKELESYLIQLFLHLLKWKYQPNMRTKSWLASIKIHRRHAKKHLSKNPSLKGYMDEIIEDSYEYARIEASNETGLDLDIFPEKIPFNDFLNDEWLPD